MAPATAVLSMLVGAALWFSARGEGGRRSLKLATALASAGIAASSLFLLLRVSGTYWPAELLGLRLSGPAALDPTAGFVSPITAAGFLLVNATLLLAAPGRRRNVDSWVRHAVGGAVAVAGFVLLLVGLFGPPLLSSAGIVPVAVNTSVVLLIMGLGLLVVVVGPAVEPCANPATIWRGRAVYTSIFAAAAVLAVAAGYAFYRTEEREIRGETEHELDMISQLKVSQLREWRQERLADAGLIYSNPLVSGLARRLINQPDDGPVRREFEAWWRDNQAHLHSDAFALTDAHGLAVFSMPSVAMSPPEVVAAARRTGEVSLLDFYLDERDQRASLATIVPIKDAGPAGRLIGVLMIRLEPQRFLYPFIAQSVGRSTTAETLLVRRDGDSVQFLSPLMFDPVSPLRKRISLDEGRLLAVKAVLGQTGLVEGLDYRGEPVISVVRAIPESPWFLIARKDTAEFRAALWRRFWLVATFATVVLFATAAGLGLVWRDQRARFYRSQANLANDLRQNEERYRRSIESAADATAAVKERLELATGAASIGIWDWDVATKGIIWDSRMFELYGLPSDSIDVDYERWMACVHPDDRERVDGDVRRALSGLTSYVSEFRVVWPDGTRRRIAAVGHVTTDDHGRAARMLGVNYDVTARWVANNQLRSLVFEKEALLREVHHRVKNNLQVIMSLLRLEAERAGQPTTIQVLREMQGRIFAMASLHESLYRSDQLDRVDLSDYIRRVCTQLFQSASIAPSAVRLLFDLEPVYLELHQAIPCGLLVNELVSNSLKHGFPDGRTGEIRVELHAADDGTLQLAVSDSGVGLPADFDSRRNGSLGLQLVADLARQLNGVLEVDAGPGAAFSLAFIPVLANSAELAAKSA